MKIDLGNILILSPHYDDWFFGCWAFINRGSGTILVFSTGAAVGDPDEEARKEEMTEARKIIPPFWTVVEAQMFMARQFFLSQDKIRDAIYKAVQRLKPKTLLIPGGRHEDHCVVRDEAERICENVKLNRIYYYVNMNSLKPKPTVVVHLTEQEAHSKAVLAQALWKSQSNRLAYLQAGGEELYRWEEGEW
jgi:LmbE family N-acetylglucosaminyl deacetylase